MNGKRGRVNNTTLYGPRLAGLPRSIKYLIYAAGVVSVFILTIEFVFPRLKGYSRAEYLCAWLGDKNTTFLGVNINSQGLTGDVISLHKKPGEVEILTLGGSSFYLRNMTEKLKKSLKEIGMDNVRVTGGVFPGNDSRSSLLKYRHLLPRHDFNYLIICHGVNDLWANRVAAEDFRSDYSHLDPSYKIFGSVIIKLIYYNLIWKKSQETDEYNHYPSENAFRENISTLIRESRSHGTEVILMTYPFYIHEDYSKEAFKKGLLDYNKNKRELSTAVEDWGTPEHIREGLRRHNRIIRELAKEYGVPLIDQDRLMPAEGRLFSDFCHLSIPGVDRFISHISNHFKQEKGWLPQP